MPLGQSTTSQTTQTSTEEETPVAQVTESAEVVNTNLPDVNLIVENGSGVPNANSYCDLDYALEYCTMKGYTSWQSLSENEQKVFIIRGTDFVDNFFTWKGRKCRSSQSLSFPRVELYDEDRYEVHGIPDKLKKACIEAAFLNSTSGADTLFSTKDENGQVKRQRVDSLEIEYFANSSTASNGNSESNAVDYTSIYDILNKLLKGLYKTGNERSTVCTQARYGW